MTLFSLTLILFLIMDPMGNIIPFLNLTKELPPARKRLVIVREMLIALGAMLLFNWIGEILFYYLGFTECSLRLASGLILFLIALKIIFSSQGNLRANLPPGEPFVFPLAIPLIAGPALLATIMLYTHLAPSQPLMLSAIVLSWLMSSIILLFSNTIYKFFGKNGLSASERLMGMVLILIAIQRFADGVQVFITGKC